MIGKNDIKHQNDTVYFDICDDGSEVDYVKVIKEEIQKLRKLLGENRKENRLLEKICEETIGYDNL